MAGSKTLWSVIVAVVVIVLGVVAWMATQPPAGAPTATSPVPTTSPSPTSPAQTPTAAQTPQTLLPTTPTATQPPPGKCPDEIVIGTPMPISGRYAAEAQYSL